MYWPNEGGLRITDSSAICLNHVLKNKFPHLDYVLLIVDQDENFKQDSFEKIEENLFKINYCKPTSMRDERMIETIFDIHRIITPSGN